MASTIYNFFKPYPELTVRVDTQDKFDFLQIYFKD